MTLSCPETPMRKAAGKEIPIDGTAAGRAAPPRLANLDIAWLLWLTIVLDRKFQDASGRKSCRPLEPFVKIH